MDFSIPPTKLVYHPLSRLVPLFIQQRYDTNPAVRSTCSQKIYLLCLSGVEGLLSGAQKPLNDHVTNLQLWSDDPSGALPLRDLQAGASGEGWSMRWHSSIDYHFLAVKLKCVIPGSETVCRKRRV